MSTLRFQVARKFQPLWQPARYKGVWGGRGSGKSHGFAELMVGTAMTKPGLRAVCVREVQKSLKHSAKLLIEDKIRDKGLQGHFEMLDSEIRTPGGGIIIFQGMQNHTADSVKSLEGFDVAWCEEAQSLSQRSLDLLRPTIRSPGSELWFSWNPNQPDDPVEFLRGDNPPSDSVVVEMNWSDNPWLPDELRDEQEDDKRRDPGKWEHIWNGGYQTNSEARVFRNWRVAEFDTPKDAIHRFGADWGFAVDPTVLVRCHIDGRTLYVDQEAWEVGCEIDHLPSLFAGDDAEMIGHNREPRWQNPRSHKGIEGSRKWVIRADSARPETVSYMKRQGFRVVPAIKGPGSIEDGVEFLRSFDIVVHPRCEKVIRELTLYAYKTDDHTGEILPVLEDKNNHTIDALRYALEELRRSGYKPKARAKPPRRDGYWPRTEADNDWMTV